MAESKELKPKSFRIDDKTADKFKEISGAIGGNQQETLAKLIEAYEFQAGKAILTDKKEDIEQFEKYVSIITSMFMRSLEDNQNVTETVRTEFDAQLKSKDATIQDLQEKLTVSKQLKDDAIAKAKAHADENVRLNGVIASLKNEYESKADDLESMLEDKDKLNRALTDSCNDLKRKVDDMLTEHEELQNLKREHDIIAKERDALAHDKDQLQKDLNAKIAFSEKELERQKQHEAEALERLKEQSQLTMDKTILKLEKKHQEQIEKLKEQKQNEVDKYQLKYFDLLEKLQTEQKVNESTEND